MIDFTLPLPPNFDSARMTPLGQHPADDAENFLTIVAFRAAVACNKPIARKNLATAIVDRRMIYDQRAWREVQRTKKPSHPIFLDAVSRSKR